MSFFVQTGPTARGALSERLGTAIGAGIGQNIMQRQQAQQQRSLAEGLFGDESEIYQNLPLETQLQAARMQQTERMQQQKLAAAGLPQYKPITVKDLTTSWASRGFDKEAFGIIPNAGWAKILDRANELQSTLGPDKAIMQAQEEYLNPEEAAKKEQKKEQLKDEKLEQQNLGNIEEFSDLQDDESQEGSFARGVKSSIAGRLTAILNDIPYDQYQSSVSLGDDPDFLDRLKYSAAKISGDLPFIGAGASGGASGGAAIGAAVGGPFGAAAGGIVGGGAGALALPAVLDTALEEYHKFKSNGYEGSFEDFLNASGKTLKVGVEAGVEGAMFGTLSKALGVFKNASPLFASFLEKSKVPEAVATGVVEATGLLTAKAVAKGELPSKEEITDTLAQVVGLNVVHALPKTVSAKIGKTGQPVEKIVREVEREIQDKGYDKNNVKHVERAITDVTDKYEGEIPEKAKDVFETLKRFEVEAPKAAEEAKALSERDIEKTYRSQEAREKRKAKGPTEKEAAKKEQAAQELVKVEEKIENNREDIGIIRNSLKNKKLNPKDRKTFENAIKLKEAEIKDLKAERVKQEYISRRGIEPFSEKALEKPIEKHLSELEAAAKDPEGIKAKVWEELFKRDQKYIDEFSKIASKGKLPDAKYKDRYVKILEVYKKAYANMIKQVEDLIIKHHESIEGVDKRTKKSKETRKEIDSLKRKLDLLRRNKAINEAKTGKQVDKINQMYTLNKPGSPVTKQILKGLRREIPQLQRDFIKQKKELDAIEKRSQSVYKKNIERLEKMADDYHKNPSDAKLKKIVEESGVKSADVKTAKQTGKDLAENLIEKVKEKAPKEEVMNAIEKVFNKLPSEVTNQAKYMLVSIAITEAKEALERLIGVKVPYTGFSVALAALADIKRGTLFYVYNSLYRQAKKAISEWSAAKTYRELKTPQEKIKHIKKLKAGGYTPSEIKKIMKS